MAKIELLDSYEELVVCTAEIRESLEIIHEWLSTEPKFDDYWSYYDLIAAHGAHFALLNLITFRLDSLIEEHTTIIEKGR
jgi:hypothetical protein|nr:MAG TPA: hypothetical protein [Caudoviricetes sp.]